MVYSISVTVEKNMVTMENYTNYVYSSNSLIFGFQSKQEAEIELTSVIKLIHKLFKFETQWFIQSDTISLNLLKKTTSLLNGKEEEKLAKTFDYALDMLRRHFRFTKDHLGNLQIHDE